MEKQNGYVELYRRKSLSNAFRAFSLLIDNQKIDVIKSGQKSRYELVSGKHELQVALDFYKSPSLTINLHAGEVLSLECGDRGTETLQEALSLKGITDSLQAITSPKDYLYIISTGSISLPADEQPVKPGENNHRSKSNRKSQDGDFGIFVSYRREDSRAMTGRLCDRLADHFGQQAVFRDVDSIPLGVDFRSHIEKTIAKSEVLLVVIGPGWLGASDSHGQQRLTLTDDFVRLEIESALQQDIPLIPVMVDGADVPDADTLPDSLQELSYKNALKIPQEPFFHAGVDRLIESLEILNGHKQPEQETKARLFCTGCGTRLDTNQKFCTSCGKPA